MKEIFGRLLCVIFRAYPTWSGVVFDRREKCVEAKNVRKQKGWQQVTQKRGLHGYNHVAFLAIVWCF